MSSFTPGSKLCWKFREEDEEIAEDRPDDKKEY